MSPDARMTITVSMLRRLPLLALAALALVAAGCGGGAESQAPTLRSLTGVAKASASAETGRFELSMRQTVPGLQQAFELSASGSFDTSARRMALSLDLGALAKTFGALGAAFGAQPDDPKAKALLDPQSWQVDAVLDGFVMYLRLPFLAPQLPSGKSWVRVDVRQAAAAKGLDLGRLESYFQSDPRQSFEYLKAVAGKVVPMGREEVRGTDTTRYRAMIDLARYAQLVPAGKRKALGDFERMARQYGLTLLPVTVWVDDESRVRRMDLELAIEPAPGQKARSSLRMEMFDYGKRVVIDLPDPAEVADAATLKK